MGWHRARWTAAITGISLLCYGGGVAAAQTAPDEAGEVRILPAASDLPVDDGRPVPQDPLAGVPAVEEYARTQLAEIFAGLYLDGTAADAVGTLVLAFTTPPTDRQKQALLDLAGDVSVDFRTADYSLAALERVQREVTQAMPDLERQGVDVAAVGVDVMANRVQVMVTGEAEQAAAILGQRFDGDMIQVVEGEAVVPLPYVEDQGEAPAGGTAVDAAGHGAGDAAGDAADDAAAATAGDPAGGDGDASNTPEPKQGFWQRLVQAVRSWWQSLFG